MMYSIPLPNYSTIKAYPDNEDDLILLMNHPYGGESDDVKGKFLIHVGMRQFEFVEEEVEGTFKEARARFKALMGYHTERDQETLTGAYKKLQSVLDPTKLQ